MSMLSSNIRTRYQRACQQASLNLLRHPQPSMSAQLQQLAEEVTADDDRDSYGSGHTLQQFEQDVAAKLGKEAGLFLPAGTLAQPLALKLHSDKTQRPAVALHPTSHMLLHEQMGIEKLWQLDTVAVGNANHPFSLEDIKALSVERYAAIVWELPMREIGGQLPNWEALVKQVQWARQQGIACHLDGARIWQAEAAYGRSLSEICDLFDSVYVSFYKDLGGINGALLAADKRFIEDAKPWARRAGGNLISVYPEVLAARKGFRENLPLMHDAVSYARELGAALSQYDGLTVTPNPPQAAMFHLRFALAPEVLAAAITEYVEQHGVILLPLPRSGDSEHAVCEIPIGRNALSQPQDVWLRHFKQFLAAAPF